MGKHKCNKCQRWFDENDLDRDGGGWICRDCEDEDKEINFGGVF